MSKQEIVSLDNILTQFSKRVERFIKIIIDKYEVSESMLTQILMDLSIRKEDKNLITVYNTLLEGGMLQEEDLAQALAELDGVQYFDYFARKDEIDTSILDNLSEEDKMPLKEKSFFPVWIDEEKKIITVAFKNANNFIARNAAEEVLDRAGYSSTEYSIVPVLVSLSAIEDYMFRYLKKITREDLYRSAMKIKVLDEKTTESGDLLVSDTSARDFLSMVIARAIYNEISDVHFESKDEIGRIRIRKHGVLSNLISFDIRRFSSVIRYIANITSGVDMTQKNVAQDGRIDGAEFLDYMRRVYNIRDVDYRVSFLPNVTVNMTNPELSSYSVVIRILSRKGGIVRLSNLGFNKQTRKVMDYVSKKATGVFVITGPTGSGKTTTLYSMLSTINGIEKNIITVEDPVEYRNPMWKQTQVNERAEDVQGAYTFKTALRHLLRHDPDVVLLGEIRDRETAQEAFRAANTGHLVLTTLHTNDAVTAILRLLDLGVDKFLVVNTVLGVSGQRLVRTLCPFCAIKTAVQDDDINVIKLRMRMFMSKEKVDEVVDKIFGDSREIYAKNPNGCKKCDYKGYRGRTVISEIIQFDTEVKKMVNENAYDEIVSYMLTKDKRNNMFIDGLYKVKEGVTTIEEILRVL